MSPVEIIAIVALSVYAIYKQTHVSEVTEQGRFKMAVIYGIVGLAVGGFVAPQGGIAVSMLVLSFTLSAVVGLARGRLTRVWVDADGRVLRQGTALTVSLFLGLIVAKFAIGTFDYFEHVHGGTGFGEVMIMIAIMIVFQAEIVWRRAKALLADESSRTPAAIDA
jgi:hypothetical protein